MGSSQESKMTITKVEWVALEKSSNPRFWIKYIWSKNTLVRCTYIDKYDSYLSDKSIDINREQ